MKKVYLKTLSLIVFLITFSLKNEAQTQGSRPNMIVILADDLGYGDVGFNRGTDFPEGLGIIPTPNIDLLANNGVICTNAHVAHPFCGPSRAAILTGMYPHRIGAQYNLPNDITSPLGIPTNETFFSTLIDDTNYNTAAFGKWHVGFEEGKYQPLDRGFDYFFGFLGGGKEYFENSYERNFYNTNTTPWTPKGTVTNEYKDPIQRNRSYIDYNEFSNEPNEDYLTDIITDDAINYISTNAAKPDPFFMYLAYNAPHTPLEAPDYEIAQFKTDNPDFEDLVRNSTYLTESQPVEKLSDPAEKEALIEKFVEARIVYATMVANLDRNIGRLVDELRSKNALDNTVIVFFSDNGGYRWSKGAVNYPLASQKGSVDDGGHKVPFFVHWPDQITTPKTYEYKISALDIYPTLVNLAGGTIPSNKIIDGKDFMDAMLATPNQNIRPNGESIYVIRPQNGFHNGSIMSYPYKIVKKGGSTNATWKLFNTENDPGETTNIRGSEPNGEQIVQDLLDQAIEWVKDFKDVKPAWFDHERNGGHPHRDLWFGTEALPGYDRLLESPEVALGVDDVINNIFTIYPNPATNEFNIKFKKTTKQVNVELLTVSGKSIKKINLQNVSNSSLNISHLASGMYLLKIKADQNLSIEKVIKL